VTRQFTRGMVVLVDDDPGSARQLAESAEYAQRLTALIGAESPEPEVAAHIERAAGPEPSVDEAFACAADRGVPWVSMRANLAPPQELLGRLLQATALSSDAHLPGFAVLLGRPVPTSNRILAVVDRTEPSSGLTAYIAAAAAIADDAALDVLLIGGSDERRSGGPLQFAADQDLADEAGHRAQEAGIEMHWTLGERSKMRDLALRTVSDGRYDAVLLNVSGVDLGGRFGRDRRIAEALRSNGSAATALALLEQSTVPLIVVLDGIEAGFVSRRTKRRSVGAVLAAGVLFAAAPATASARESRRVESAVESTVTAYDEALGASAELASSEEIADAQAEAQEQAVKSAEALAEASEAAAADAAPSAAAQEAAGLAAEAQAAVARAAEALAAEAQAAEEQAADESAPDVDLGTFDPAAVTPPSAEAVHGATVAVPEGTTGADVAQADAAASATLQQAQADFAAAQKASVAAQQSLSQAAAASQEAAAALKSAGAAYQASRDADPDSAQTAAAGQEVQQATMAADQALTAYRTAAEQAEQAAANVMSASAAVEQADAAYQQTHAINLAYRTAVGDVRVSPIDSGQFKAGEPYGATGPYWSLGYHTGMDFEADAGTQVVAASGGTVVEAGYSGAYGNRVVIQHPNGYSTNYNHLSSINVQVGQQVGAGDPIGTVGATGNSYGPHLHFEVTTGGDGWSSGSFVDPVAWMAYQVG
jgi:murein DD-endopeptidase MepM/ murein hydrolase activator NlpD